MPRILTISDIHIEDTTREALLDSIAGSAERERADLILVGGDISEDAATTIAFMRELNGRAPSYYVPGNHDLWNRSNGLSTAEILAMYASDERCLLGRAVSVGTESVVVGHVGWYDYSFAAPSFSSEELRQREKDGSIWQDRLWVDFRRGDEAVCAEFNAEIEALMDEAEGKNVILLTHMVGHRAFTVSGNTRRDWTYFNGFLGSADLARLAARASVAICGHVHYRRSFRDGGTLHVCACLGYPSEWGRSGASADPASRAAVQAASAAFAFDVP